MFKMYEIMHILIFTLLRLCNVIIMYINRKKIYSSFELERGFFLINELPIAIDKHKTYLVYYFGKFELT